MEALLAAVYWSALSQAIFKAVLDTVLFVQGPCFLEAAEKVGSTRCAFDKSLQCDANAGEGRTGSFLA
jgi:hypothetical protein